MNILYVLAFCCLLRVDSVSSQTTTTEVAIPSNCKNFTLLTETQGVIDYPYDGGNYENNERACWRISVSSGRIEFYFTRVSVESSYDFIYLYDGPSYDSSQIVRISSFTSSRYYTTGSDGFVYFTSDSSAVYSGFTLVYQQTFEEPIPANCNDFEVVNGTYGVIDYPEGNGYYANNERACWRIIVPSDRIVFTVTKADLESNYDFVHVYDGPDYDSTYITTIHDGFNGNLYTTGNVGFLYFSSDSSATNTGFTIAFREIDGAPTTQRPGPSECKEYSELNQTQGAIVYPPGGGYYSSYEQACWKLTVPSGRIEIFFVRIELEPTGCDDRVTIYDGDSYNAPEIGVACDADERHFYTSGNEGFIYFTSDYNSQYTGFSLAFKEVFEVPTTTAPMTTGIPVNCKGYTEITGTSGSITHPASGTGTYQPNEATCWKVSTASIGLIKFQFSKVDLEYCYDKVAIYDGSNIEAPLIVEVCSLPTLAYYTTGNVGFIRFVSDGSDQRSGFQLDYQAEVKTTTPTTTTRLSSCKSIVDITAESGNVTYPEDGGFYGNYEGACWRIVAPTSSMIRLEFSHFDLETACYDYVNIYDGNNYYATRIARLCSYSGQVYYTTGNVAFIYFTSDSSVSGTGFQLLFRGVDSMTTVYTPTTPDYQLPENPWPQSEHLLGYWPLDSIHQLTEAVTGETKCTRCSGELDRNGYGPFAKQATSYKTNGQVGGDILDLHDVRPPLDGSLTVSVFVKAPLDKAGGLLSFSDSNGTRYLQVDILSSYNGKDRPFLRVRGSGLEESDIHGVYDVLQPDEWSFVAVVVEKTQWDPCMLSIHGRHGTIYESFYRPEVCKNLDLQTNLNLGSTAPFTAESFLSPDISVTCLMLHNSALLANEIRQAYDSCRSVQETAPCGSPLVPYPPIPETTTSVPRYGQFPWMASIRTKTDSTEILCSAAILDQYFLLTSASCFKFSTSASRYMVAVGDFDLNVVEANELQFDIQNIIVHPSYSGLDADLAIVQLASAIDLTDQYTNTICLPNLSDGRQLLSTNDTYYMFGWGENGRLSLASKSEPRYTSGSVISEDDCAAAWPQQEYDGKLTTCFESSADAMSKVPCHGDEGSVLMVADSDRLGNERLKPVAIYSRRAADCSSNKPPLFTLITPYLQWITQTIACALPGWSFPASCPINHA